MSALKPPMTAEQEEARAMEMIANGNGSWPVSKDDPLAWEGYDEVVIAFHLEDMTKVSVFLREKGNTRRQFHYKLVTTEFPA